MNVLAVARCLAVAVNDWSKKQLLLLVTLSWLSVICRCQNDLQTGLQHGPVISQALIGGYDGALTTIAGSLGPFLGACGPIMGQAMDLIVNNPGSSELLSIRALFANTKSGFNSADNDIANIRGMYSLSNCNYENAVRSLIDKFDLLYSANSAQLPSRKQDFISSYESNSAAGLGMFNAMTGSSVAGEICGQQLLQITENDRRDVQDFSTGLMALIIQAGMVETTYWQLKNNAASSQTAAQAWTSRFTGSLTSTIQGADAAVTANWYTQSGTDIDTYVQNQQSLSRKVIADGLCIFLEDKFFWRNFACVVFMPGAVTENEGSADCDDDFCVDIVHDGHLKTNLFGHNVLVAADVVQPAKSSAWLANLQNALQNAQCYQVNSGFWYNSEIVVYDPSEVYSTNIATLSSYGCTLAIVRNDQDMQYTDTTRVEESFANGYYNIFCFF